MNGVNGHADGINGHANGINGHVNGVNGHAEPDSQSKPSLRLSFTEYQRISNLLVLHLRRAEEGKKCFALHTEKRACLIKNISNLLREYSVVFKISSFH